MKHERREKKPRASRYLKGPIFPASASEQTPALHRTEDDLHSMVEGMEERILHHSDRPEIELRILTFLTHAIGPTTEGIAREMGVSSEAAAVHLEALSESKRIWGQAGQGGEISWHISHDGRHFLDERGKPEGDS